MKNYLQQLDLMKAKKALQAANVPMHTFCVQTDYHTSDFYNDCIQLAPLQAAAPCYPAECKKQKGNNPMYVDNDKHIESSKINYLTERLELSFYSKERSIDTAFNLTKPSVPSTPEDLIAAITSGNYTLPPKADRNQYDRATNQIIWRAPTVVADPDGAKAALESLKALRQTAKDTIVVGTPADALTAIKAVDAWTATAPTTTTVQ